MQTNIPGKDSSMTKSLVHRLQNWLISEPFEIHYDPKCSPPFRVLLKGHGLAKFEGTGFSISQAAKIAFKSRELFYADLTPEQISDARSSTGENP